MKYTIVLFISVVFILQYVNVNANNYDKIQTKLKQIPEAQQLLNQLVIAEPTIYKSIKYSLDTLSQYARQQINVPKDKTATKFQGFVDLEKQWYLRTCNVVSAWKIATGKGVIIAVLDTGIDYDNTDLKEQLWVNQAEDINQNGSFDNWPTTETRNGISGDLDGVDNDANGFVDDIIGYDFVDELIAEDSSYNGDRHDIDYDPKDEHKHGTEVAGVVSSIAIDSKIMAIRIHNNRGQSDCYAIAQGIIYAVLNGANVINLSSGEYDNSPLFHTAIKFANTMGVVVVASAGNDYSTRPHYPSDYKEVISVGGVNENLERIFNYGDFLDISAPGVGIYVTSKDSLYFNVAGTSYSSPIVAGVCGLLISYYKEILKKDITPAEVKTILALTANSNNGWNSQLGNGIVNAKNCLDYIEKAKFEITQPEQYSVLRTNANDSLIVKGTILLPLLENYIVRIRSCREPKTCTWDTLTALQIKQINDKELYKISLQDLLQNHPNITFGENIISITCKLKSGKNIEERVSVTICDSNELKITKFDYFQPYFNDKRIIVVNAKTTLPCRISLYYKTTSDAGYAIINSNDYITHNHILRLSELDVTQNYYCYLRAEIGGLYCNSDTFVVENINDNCVFNGRFKKQNYTMPAGNLHKEQFTINRKNAIINSVYQPNIIPNQPGNINLYVVENDSAIVVDSTKQNALCYGASDADNNGTIDFLCGYRGIVSLFTKNDNSLFGNISNINNPVDVFKDSHIAVGLFDIDNDGTTEILHRDNNGNFWVRKQSENNYTETSFNYYELLNEINQFEGNGFSVSVGNYYGNGQNYMAILSPNHDYIAIIECNEGKFSVKEKRPLTGHYHNGLSHWTHSINATIYSTNSDIDADGTDELMYLFFGKIDDTTEIDDEQNWNNALDTSDVLGKYELWTLYIYKNINGKLENIGQEDFLGVKINLAANDNYRNGINDGDVDNDGKNEIFVCAFPNLYALKWNTTAQKVEPFWFYPECNSNTVAIGDFNTNGKNEICFNDFSQAIFFEYDTTALTINYFKGFAKTANSLHFDWKCSENTLPTGTEYELWLIEAAELENISLQPEDWNADIIAKFQKHQTTETYIEINSLQHRTKWTAFVRIKNSTADFNPNQFSKPINVWTNDLTKPLSADAINRKSIKIKFSQQLNFNNYINGITIKSSINTQASIVNFTTNNDSTLLLEVATPLINTGYEIYMPTLIDFYGNPTVADTLQLAVSFEDTVELYLAALSYTPPHSLILTFSESIDKMQAPFNVQNYTLLPFGEIENISLIDSVTVQLSLSPNYALEGRGKDYMLTAKPAINANSGNTMTTGAGNTLGFVFSESNLEKAYIYPAPVSLSKHTEAYFGHLTQVTDIEILNSFGSIIRTLKATSGNGGIEWDLKDANGNLCDIGIYLAKIKDLASGNEVIIKFAIVE